MRPEALHALCAALAILVPALGFLVMGALLLLGRPLSERATARLTAAVQLLSLAGAVTLTQAALRREGRSLTVELGDWYHMAGYGFPITLLIDALSGPMMVLTVLICGVVGRFSVTYLHRERGFHRFFLLMLLFNAAMVLLVSAGSIDLLFAGWELVGLTSVLLIAFFDRREGPVQGALRAFCTYRSCDIGLLLGAVLLHHYAHSSQFGAALGVSWPLPTAHLSGGPATVTALLFVLASLGKSAQVPLTGWLPRAMEGPTPSSALFYGALSVHAGAYLLLRTAPLLARAPLASGLLVLIGLLTAIHATASGRVQADAKNALAYASATQVGVIFMEIGLGWYRLAMVHLMGHICVRSFQLLRAPSLVQETYELRAAAGAHHLHTGRHFEMILPERLRLWLYRLALERFYLDSLLDEYVARPVLLLAQACDRAHLWLDRLVSAPEQEGRP